MTDDELHARFAGLRIAIAYAIKVASGHPSGINQSAAALRELEAAVPSTIHPALKEELHGVIAALNRLPRHSLEEAGQHSHPPRPVELPDDGDLPPDLLR